MAFPEINNSCIDYVVIVPNQGCGGCITLAEEFYADFSACDNIRFIFTNILSKKMLNIKLEVNKSNTYLDSNNDILKILPSEAKIYPCIISLNEGEVVKITYQSPKEDGFSIIDYNKLSHE